MLARKRTVLPHGTSSKSGITFLLHGTSEANGAWCSYYSCVASEALCSYYTCIENEAWCNCYPCVANEAWCSYYACVASEAWCSYYTCVGNETSSSYYTYCLCYQFDYLLFFLMVQVIIESRPFVYGITMLVGSPTSFSYWCPNSFF